MLWSQTVAPRVYGCRSQQSDLVHRHPSHPHHFLKRHNREHLSLVSDQKSVQRVVRTAEEIISTSLPSTQDIAQKHCLTKANNIRKDPTDPHHELLTLLLSGRRYRSIRTIQPGFTPASFPMPSDCWTLHPQFTLTLDLKNCENLMSNNIVMCVIYKCCSVQSYILHFYFILISIFWRSFIHYC